VLRTPLVGHVDVRLSGTFCISLTSLLPTQNVEEPQPVVATRGWFIDVMVTPVLWSLAVFALDWRVNARELHGTAPGRSPWATAMLTRYAPSAGVCHSPVPVGLDVTRRGYSPCQRPGDVTAVRVEV